MCERLQGMLPPRELHCNVTLIDIRCFNLISVYMMTSFSKLTLPADSILEYLTGFLISVMSLIT